MINHTFLYKWKLSDGYPSPGIEYHGKKVLGTFISGGGSTMGYKLAGYNHLGGVEIDRRVAEIYELNHKPKYLMVEDIRTFNERSDLPAEFYDLDLLDGSPPCSTFSVAGEREKGWGKEKKFREGQKVQVLDELIFVYLETIKKLRPKVFLLENVKGIIIGNAKYYANEIVNRMEQAGYHVQVFVLNAASMGVPQTRERVFFIGYKRELAFPKLTLSFNIPPILFGEVKGPLGRSMNPLDKLIWENRVDTDRDFADTLKRVAGKNSRWNDIYCHPNRVSATITSSGNIYEYSHPTRVSDAKLTQLGTFPTDYNLDGNDAQYLVGMSVPPVMTAQIAYQIYLQWLK